MNIIFSSDQKNEDFNRKVLNFFSDNDLKVEDLSFSEVKASDYIMEGIKVGENVSIREDDLGVIISGTPHGAVMAANKVNNIRCVGIFDEQIAEEAKKNFNSNVIVLPANNIDKIIKCISIFLSTKYNKEAYNHEMTTLIDYEISCTDC